MKKKYSIIKNQDGSTIVIVMMILVILTIIGIASMKRSVSVSHIVRNEAIYKQNFSRADAATNEAIERIEMAGATDLKSWTPVWLHDGEPFNVSDISLWDNSNSTTTLTNDTRYLVVDEGIHINSSLDTSGTSLHAFSIYGYSLQGNTRVLIQAGYKKRY